MRRIETLVLVANLLAFCSLVVRLPPAIRWMRHWVGIALVIAIVHVLLEGARWQMAPAYTLTGVFVVILVMQSNTAAGGFGKHPGLSWLAVGLGVCSLVIASALPILLPVFHFPQPGGPYAIGTVTYHWTDVDRPEVFSADPQARRELMVQIWYPATSDPAASRAPYIEDAGALAVALAQLHHLPEFSFGHLKYVRTNGIPSAPIAQNLPSYPVLIFVEGITGFRQMNTFQVEALVAHGYIVAAIDQPYVAAAVVFPDGRQVAGLSKDQMNGLIQQSISPTEPTPQLNGRLFPDGIIPYLAHDAIFTLDQLTTLNHDDPNGILTGRLALQHVGVFGVSLGSIVASEACRLDARLRACLLMDAPMPANVVEGGLQQPSMWITRDAETMQREGWGQVDIDQHQTTMRAAFERLVGDGYFVQVPGMYHANLTDISAWSPLFSWLGIAGPITGPRAHRIVNAYSLAFFDQQLKGQPEALLAGSSAEYPDVRFEARQP